VKHPIDSFWRFSTCVVAALFLHVPVDGEFGAGEFFLGLFMLAGIFWAIWSKPGD
jgi:hypothetical protein